MKSKIIQKDIESIISASEDYLCKLDGKKILITGGNGFIPSYIADTLVTFNRKLENPCKLILLNKNPITDKSRLSHLLEDSNVKFIKQDVGKNFSVDWDPDIIIHAASRANPSSFLEDPLDTIDANVKGVRTLLEYARKKPIDNFLFFSSAEIYGIPPRKFIPTSEDFSGNANCLIARACYSESKRFAETLCSTFYRKYNIPVKILRIFHTYGPGLRDDGKVITDFFKDSIKNKKIELRDKGESQISFCYISDSIKGILKVMEKGKNGEAYNIGDDSNCIPIKNLAKMIGKVVNNGTIVKINNLTDYRDGFKIDKRMPDITKLRSLGFAPKIGIIEGLQKMEEHYKETNYLG